MREEGRCIIGVSSLLAQAAEKPQRFRVIGMGVQVQPQLPEGEGNRLLRVAAGGFAGCITAHGLMQRRIERPCFQRVLRLVEGPQLLHIHADHSRTIRMADRLHRGSRLLTSRAGTFLTGTSLRLERGGLLRAASALRTVRTVHIEIPVAVHRHEAGAKAPGLALMIHAKSTSLTC